MKAFTLINEYWSDLVNLFFPNVCIHCNTVLVYQENHLCTKCRLSLPKTNYHLEQDNPLQLKFVYEPKVQHASAYLHFNKGGVAQRLVHEMKYAEQPEIGVMLGQWYGHDLVKCSWELDMIIPVPIHRSKLKQRGFNQSERIASGLSEIMGVPVADDVVIRKKRTATQTRKSKLQRWQNVDSIYAMTQSGAVSGKRVMVVDDVITTGATLGELVNLLVDHGAASVYISAIGAGK